MGKKIILGKKIEVTKKIQRETHRITRPSTYVIAELEELEEEEIEDEEQEDEEDIEDDDSSNEDSSENDSNEESQDNLFNKLKDKFKKNKKNKPNDNVAHTNNPNSTPTPTGNVPTATIESTTATAGTTTTTAGTTAASGAATASASGTAATTTVAAGGTAVGGVAAGSAIGCGTILIILLVVFILIIIIGLFRQNSSSVSFGGHYSPRCSEMTVIFVDSSNGYEVTDSKTYSMEDYVAGVVYAEVGMFADKEVFKTYALAARTFALEYASEDCTIEGSARRQAFRDITEETGGTVDLVYEAVKETEGQVLISNGQLYPVAYDAFCYIDKDDNYYTLSQQSQKIPVSWVESNIGNYYYKNCPCNSNDESMTECWRNGSWRDGGHGGGMSQYGALYLIQEQGYTYDQVLEYYYGDEGVSIASSSFMSSVAGLEIKDTSNSSFLQEPIADFLSSNGSSLEEMNAFIHNSVTSAGVGTRAGVVTAAVSMINYLYDNFNTRLPYYWGGSSQTIGLPKKIGIYSPSKPSSYSGKVNYHISFDCSGFVSWAIKNGGYNLGRLTTVGFHSTFSQNSCNIKDSDCIGQPGDLINSNGCHVQMIIAVDQENEKYYIAESSDGVVMHEWGMHSGNCGNKETRIIYMDDYYNNIENINPNY